MQQQQHQQQQQQEMFMRQQQVHPVSLEVKISGKWELRYHSLVKLFLLKLYKVNVQCRSGNFALKVQFQKLNLKVYYFEFILLLSKLHCY